MTEMVERRFPYRIIPGVLISLLALAVLFWISDAEKLLAGLKGVDIKVLIVSVMMVILSLFARAYSWREILAERVSLQHSFLIINAGYFVNTVLPFRLGEIARALMLRPAGLGFWEALPAVALERMIDVIIGFSLLILSLPSAMTSEVNVVYSFLMIGIVAVGILVIFLMVRFRDRILAWLDKSRFSGSRLFTRAVQLYKSVLEGFLVLSSPGRLIKVFLGMGLCWALAVLFQFILLRSFIPEAKLIWAAFTMGAVAVGVSIPSSPGNIGLYEGSITLALSAFGVDPSLALSYALTSHLLNLGITTGFGVYGLVRIGVGLRDIWQFGRQKKGEKI